MSCRHEETERGKLVHGGGFHVVEYCRRCRVNVNGPNVYVQRRHGDESLPVWRDRRTPEQKGEQPLLFG